MITLVIGGTRSGKSVVAERLAARLPRPVTYFATAAAAGDPDMAARVAAHRARRPPDWSTVEHGEDLVGQVRRTPGTVLLDALGPWVAAAPGLRVDVAALCAALAQRHGDTVVVTEEVGLGVHAVSDAGRRFADALGELNQAVAAAADEVIMVVAGRVLPLGQAG